MKKIKPAYVTFEQAKLLKEKWKFNEICGNGYTKRKGTLTPIVSKNSEDIVISAPEHWQVVEWLRVEKGIWINIQIPTWSSKGFRYAWEIIIFKNKQGYEVYETFKFPKSMFSKYSSTEQHLKEGFKSPQEAYSAAFDYILSTLKNEK